MKFQRRVIFHFIGVLLLAGCGKTSPPPAPVAPDAVDPVQGHLLHAQRRLPATRVLLGDPSAGVRDMQTTTAEIARQSVEIATGMMFRTNMPENEAMLFVFPNAERRSFYMRNCIVPLSAAYISPTGEILEIIDMQPHNELGIPSTSANVQFVLEVPQGWFSRHHISLGAVVRTEQGSLRETFFSKQ